MDPLDRSPPDAAPPLARARGLATRTRLLDEAERRFAESGFHGVSLTEIANVCGVGNAGLLHHFPSKSRLYRAVLQRLADDLEARLVRAAAARTPKARLVAALRQHLDYVLERPAGARLLLRELLDNVERLEHARTLPLADFTAGMCRLIQDAQAAGAAARGPAIVQLCQYLGAVHYGLVVRPTFLRLKDRTVLRDDEAWLRAVAGAAAKALLRP
jgi:TetR/AcrR family transcriptional regulator